MSSDVQVNASHQMCAFNCIVLSLTINMGTFLRKNKYFFSLTENIVYFSNDMNGRRRDSLRNVAGKKFYDLYLPTVRLVFIFSYFGP